jgi:hypothetical protein
MRILFDNLIFTATLSAGGTSINYPLSNLVHSFLVKKFQQTVDGTPIVTYEDTPITYEGEDVTFRGMDDNDALTLTWDNDKIIDFIGIGYSNALYFTLRLYNSSDEIMFTKEFTSDEMGAIFTPVSGVRKAKIFLDDDTDPMTVYVGKVGIGKTYTMPDPINDWDSEITDNSFGTTGTDGQIQGQYIEPYEAYTFNFAIDTLAQKNAIKALVKNLGKMTPAFVIPFEGKMDVIQPLYATIAYSSPSKEDNVYRFTLTITEAR